VVQGPGQALQAGRPEAEVHSHDCHHLLEEQRGVRAGSQAAVGPSFREPEQQKFRYS